MRTIFLLNFLFVVFVGIAQDLDVTEFGADPSGQTLSTKAIQSAIDKAYNNGGGIVTLKKGTYLSGSIVLKSGTVLQVEKGATLLGSPNPSDYIKINRWKAFIIADGQENIGVIGDGQIDGQGRKVALHLDSLFYAGQLDSNRYNLVEMRPKYYLRPQLIEFVNCKNIEVRDITLRNAACWVQTHHQSENIVIDNVRTESDAYWNNDGIDIQDCRNVRITNCYVNSADDGICLKSHSSEMLCENVYIANCTVRSSASAIKFGTRSHGGFKNVTIEKIKVFNTFRSAIAIECVDGGDLDGVTIRDIKAFNVGNAIFIRLGKRHTDEVGTLKNVTIRNVVAHVAFKRPDYKYDIRGPELPFFHNPFPSSITGIPGHKVKNVTLENIKIYYPGRGNNGLANLPISRLDDVPENEGDYPEFSMFKELPAWGFYVRHVDGLVFEKVKIKIAKPDYRPAYVFDDVNSVYLNRIKVKGDDKDKDIILYKTLNVSSKKQDNILLIKD